MRPFAEDPTLLSCIRTRPHSADIDRLDEAEACCKKAISLDPMCCHVYETLGVVMRRSKRPAKAISYYNEAVRLYEPAKGTNRALACLYSNMGTAMADLDRLEDSVRCYDESIKVDPSYATAYRNKSASLQQMGRLDEATQCMMTAIMLNPDFAEQILNPDRACNRAAVQMDRSSPGLVSSVRFGFAAEHAGTYSRSIRAASPGRGAVGTKFS